MAFMIAPFLISHEVCGVWVVWVVWCGCCPLILSYLPYGGCGVGWWLWLVCLFFYGFCPNGSNQPLSRSHLLVTQPPPLHHHTLSHTHTITHTHTHTKIIKNTHRGCHSRSQGIRCQQFLQRPCPHRVSLSHHGWSRGAGGYSSEDSRDRVYESTIDEGTGGLVCTL